MNTGTIAQWPEFLPYKYETTEAVQQPAM